MAVNAVINVTANVQPAINAFNRLDRSMGRPRLNTDALALSFRRVDRIWTLLAAGSGLAMISTFVKMGIEMQKLRIQIGIFEKSSARVPAVMESIFNLASRVPISLETLTGAFVKLKAAGLEPIVDAEGNGILKNLADGFAAMGSSEEQIKRAFIGIQQIMGKGVVSMEELRQQIGEAMPLAMRAMARGMQISVAELIYQVSRGKVEAVRGLTAMSEEFKRAFGGMAEVMKNTLGGQIQQFRTEMTRLADTMLVGSGALDRFGALLKKLNEAIANTASPREAGKFAEYLWQQFERLAYFAAEAYPLIQNLGYAIGAFISTIAGLMSALPAQVAAGGIIGWLIFGPRGFVIGAVAATVGDELTTIISIISAFVNSITGMVPGSGGGAGGFVSKAATFGLLGWLIAGPSGALIGFVAAVITSLQKQIGSFLGWLSGAFQGVLAQFGVWKKAFKEGRLDVISINSEAIAAGKKVADAHKKAFKEMVSGWTDGKQAAAEYRKRLEEIFKDSKKMADENQKLRDKSIDELRGLQDYGGLTNQQITQAEDFLRLLTRMEGEAGNVGNAVQKAYEKNAKGIEKVNAILDDLHKKLRETPAGDTDLAEGYEKAIEKFTELRDRAVSLNDQIASDKANISLERLGQYIDSVNARLAPYIEGHTKAGTKLEAHKAAMDRILVSIDRQKTALRLSTLDGEERAKGLKALEELELRVNLAREKGLDTLNRGIGLKRQDREIDLSRATEALEHEVNMMDARNTGNKALEARERALKQVDGLYSRIAEKILEVRRAQADGLISADAANSTISRLESVREKLGEVGSEFVERAEFNASAFGEMMNSITSSMQSSLSDAIVGLVDGTKSIKDVLLDLYKSITKAAADYIAKLIIMQAFGAPGGQAGFGLSKMIMPFGSGGLFGGGGGGLFSGFFGGFAEGGRFIVGGQGGTDMNTVGVRASSGEEITVGKPGEFTGRSGFGGGSTNITIQAVDAASVRELFMKEGSALVEALNRRGRLNRA